MKLVFAFAPAIALACWAAAAAAGLNTELLRVVGPAVTAIGSYAHFKWEVAYRARD